LSGIGVLLADDGVDGNDVGQARVIGARVVSGYQGAAYVFTPSVQ
jgi:hypothetical protein